MAWKNLKQRTLAEAFLPNHKALTELDEVNNLIDWSVIETLLRGIYDSTRGAKAFPPLMMFKALLLQAWYRLSDPQLEQQLARDLLFRRFVGLDLSAGVPDHSTLWRFRQKLNSGLWERLFEAINDQLSEQSLYIKAGAITIIDASVIQAKNNRPHKGVEGENTQDKEAGYSVKAGSDGHRRAIYGFKAHISVEEDGFVKSTEFTAGNVHDSRCFEALISGDEEAVYADSAYKSKKHDKFLAKKGIKNAILDRAYRNRPLSKDQKAKNRHHSKTRSTVERVFGILKLHYGMAQARFRGLIRNHTNFGVMCMAYNLKRGVAIQREIALAGDYCA